jgi:propionate CoA-transferase
MRRNKIVGVEDAMKVILPGDTIATGGFVGIGFPEHLAAALERRFLETGGPRDLDLIFAAGQGDGRQKGLNHFGHPGMVARAIGGHWGLAPALGALALAEEIDAYCLPQGVISHWFRDVAGGRPGTLTRVGLGTFIDPRLEGGRLNTRSTADIVELVTLADEQFLFVPRRRIDVALLRGTTADEEGNVSMEREAVTLESLSIAQAAKNSGGLVIVQVERTVAAGELHPRDVRIPGILVDAVVVSPPEDHQQTFAEAYNPAYTGEVRITADPARAAELTARMIIARRAAMFLTPNAVVNLGIGIPEGVAAVAQAEGILDMITLTVEAGGIGGIPAGGLSFGATTNAQAIVDQPYQFDFYDGGGLDQAFLGMAEVDMHGNVNVSSFGSRVAGPGGFINISQAAKEVYFMGLFRAGALLAVQDARLRILREGEGPKFVAAVRQITFSGRQSRDQHQSIVYITERCVLRLGDKGLEIIEVAPGIDLDKDVLAQMSFRPSVSPNLVEMDPALFTPEPMGLAHRAPTPLVDRFTYDPSENVLFCNFEGLVVDDIDAATALAARLDHEFERIGHRVNVIVNYDNFHLAAAAEPAFFEMINHNERYVLSRTRYSSNAYFRRRLGHQFTAASLEHRLYGSYATARDRISSLQDASARRVPGVAIGPSR